MLMLMKSQTEAMRALAYVVAAALDFANRSPDERVKKQSQAFVDLMIPIVKGWSTETGIEIASLGVQVHGGMGFVEETGAAQYLRDARITTIYEGTTGIQAMDLVGRKIAREGGRHRPKAWLGELEGLRRRARALGQRRHPEPARAARRRRAGVRRLRAVHRLREETRSRPSPARCRSSSSRASSPGDGRWPALL
jgi:acyl-CoA dehydrogenase